MTKKGKKEDFDNEPVYYCAKCYSLNIIHEDVIDTDCCGECGCSDIKTSSVKEWEKLFKERYGHKFVEDGNLRKSPIFQMSNDKLKTFLYKEPSWRLICSNLYPTFPNWLSKADSIILLFAKLCQDNRIDDLRMELYNRTKI